MKKFIPILLITVLLISLFAFTACSNGISINGDLEETVEAGSKYEDPGVTIPDDYTVVTEGEVDTAKLGKYKIVDIIDYQLGINGLPKSNVLKIMLDGGSTLVVRPSGTEPKIKVYISIKGNSIEDNNSQYDAIIKEINGVLQ